MRTKRSRSELCVTDSSHLGAYRRQMCACVGKGYALNVVQI